MSPESTSPDLVERARSSVERLAVRTTNYTDIDQARAAAERLAESRE